LFRYPHRDIVGPELVTTQRINTQPQLYRRLITR
jgi:hypothetical protein